MLLIAHLGVGLRLVRILKPVAPVIPILFGTILPDLIDKPLYYGLSFFTGKEGAELGLISCTRTFGHSAFMIFFILGFGLLFKKNKSIYLLIALGVFSHHLLDFFQDSFLSQTPLRDSSSLIAFLFPFYKSSFSIQPTHSLRDHFFTHLKDSLVLGGELIGLTYLIIEYKKFKKTA